MTTSQILAYYAGVLITSSIVFFILRTISIIYLETKRKKIFLKENSNATFQEIEKDFQQYFSGFKYKYYISLVVIVVLIYLFFSK
ncbi:MAG: hypothetical protein WCO12_03435 [bacterium]